MDNTEFCGWCKKEAEEVKYRLYKAPNGDVVQSKTRLCDECDEANKKIFGTMKIG